MRRSSATRHAWSAAQQGAALNGALHFSGAFGWSGLAVHGAINLAGPTSLRATPWRVVPTAFVVAVILRVFTVRRQWRSAAMEERRRQSWTANATPGAPNEALLPTAQSGSGHGWTASAPGRRVVRAPADAPIRSDLLGTPRT